MNRQQKRKQQPHVQIKELKKQLDTFQLEVENLLRDVPSTDNLCILCNNRDSKGHYDLPCQHVLCFSCQKQYRKRDCPQCHPHNKKAQKQPIEKDTSSSSEEL